MMRPPSPLPGHARRGAVAIQVAVCLSLLMAIVAIVLDGGILLEKRWQVHTAADAAALAAATDLFQNYNTNQGADPDGTARKSAQTTAAAHGFTTANSDLTIHISPEVAAEGIYAGKALPAGYVEVILRYRQQRYFSRILGSDDLNVAGRAVARGKWQQSKIGVLLLDPSAQGALTLSGSAQITVPNSTIIVDSSHTKAVVGSSTVVMTATDFDITGTNTGYSLSGSARMVGNIQTGVAATPDPLKSLAQPTATDYTPQYASKLSISGGSHSLQPGRYTGGIAISNAAVTLSPGIYYIENGDFSMSGSSSLQGDGVMIYAEHKVTVSASGTVNLTPPSTGTYNGMVLFQDRSAVNYPLTLSGSSGMSIQGTLYAANAAVKVTGSSGQQTVGSQYISRTLEITGSGTVNIDTSKRAVGERVLGLVE